MTQEMLIENIIQSVKDRFDRKHGVVTQSSLWNWVQFEASERGFHAASYAIADEAVKLYKERMNEL